MTSHHEEGPSSQNPQGSQSPQVLRNQWEYWSTLHRKQCVVADAMGGMALAAAEMVSNGEELPTHHGSPEFVAEALRDGARTAQLAANTLARMEQSADLALAAAVQQN